MTAVDSMYARQLVEVLKKRDTSVLREFLKSEAAAREPERVAEIDAIPDHDLEVRMYKMIIARPELGTLHADARRWLREHDVELHF